MPRYTDPETGKSIFSQNPLDEEEISEALSFTKEKTLPQTRQGSYTPEEKQQLQSDVLRFIWPGKEEAARGFIKGTTTALGLGGAAAATALSPTPLSPALGYAAGERLGRGIESLAGVSKPETMKESAIATGVDIGIGLLPYGVTKASQLATKLPSSFRGTTKKIFQGVKSPYEVEKGATVGLRKGAERGMGELENVEQQLYKQARAGTKKEILEGASVNFENTTTGLNNFEQTEIFGRLHPPEKAQIRSAMKQIRKEISPGARTGKTAISPEEMEDIIETGTGEFIQGGGQVRMPGTFTQARATRSWLSKESHQAYKKGNENLGNAYKELKNMHELDIEKAVGEKAWAGWKEADTFKTKKHIMDEIFGVKGKAELKPGKYNFEKIKNNIKEIPTKRFEAAGFTMEDIQALRQISDVGKFRSFVETHPTLKALIPIEIINELLGLKLPVPSVTRAGRYILGRWMGI